MNSKIVISTEEARNHVIALAEQRVLRLEALLKHCLDEVDWATSLAMHEEITKELLGRPCMEEQP